MNPTEIAHPFRRFTYDGISIRVESVEPSHLTWLEEFLTPAYTVSNNLAYEARVLVDLNRERYKSLSEGRAAGTSVDCFALDNSVISLPRWLHPSEEDVVYDNHFQVFYTRRGNEFSIVAPPRHKPLRTPLMRVVREFTMNHCQRAGRLVLHASGIAWGDNGIIFTGPKRSGKTSLLTYSVKEGDASYLGNDRLLVAFDGSAVRMRGMPAIITFRPKMLELFPDVRERLLAGSYYHRATLAELAARNGARTQPWSDGRFGLSPAQFCQLLKVQPLAAARARVLLFPQVTNEAGELEIIPIAEADALERLSHSLFGVRSWRKSSDFFVLPAQPPQSSPETLRELCRELVQRIPCFECRVGLQAYADRQTADTLRHLVE